MDLNRFSLAERRRIARRDGILHHLAGPAAHSPFGGFIRRWFLPVFCGIVLGGTVAIFGINARADEAAQEYTMSAIDRTARAYEAILADIRTTYPMEAGGGITALRQTATTTFEATISREEVSDIWTYEIDFGADGAVTITDRSERTE